MVAGGLGLRDKGLGCRGNDLGIREPKVWGIRGCCGFLLARVSNV